MLMILSITAIPASAQNQSPVVSNVMASQNPGTGQVTVTYDVSDAEGDQVTARLICSSNNGADFDLLPVSVSGNVNIAMAPGPGKQILWNAAADYPGRYWSQVVAKVVVSQGPSSSGEMVFVPAGNFTMGSTNFGECEYPIHTVYLDAFYIDKYEVTNAQFKAFIDAGGYTTQAYWSPAGWSWRFGRSEPAYWTSAGVNAGPGYPGFPVIGVSYYEAEAYAAFAGKRLPTEAEWEKGARGTDARTYPWGEAVDGGRANYYDSGDPYGPGGSTPVGFYDGTLYTNPPFQTIDSPSPFGAYDMAGNVAEWVRDWYNCNYYNSSPAANPPGPISGSERVVRGGMYNAPVSYMTSSKRNYVQVPHAQDTTIGFRCARSGP